MNRVLIAILIAFSLQACAQEKVVLEKPTVDKKVELLSIVFRLAEKQEYSDKWLKPYVGRIEQYFEKYKNHELIQFTKSIISENGLGCFELYDNDNYSKEDLKIVRNTIYAQKGYVFKNQELRDYFSQFEWYMPDPNLTMEQIELTEREKILVNKIIERERK